MEEEEGRQTPETAPRREAPLVVCIGRRLSLRELLRVRTGSSVVALPDLAAALSLLATREAARVLVDLHALVRQGPTPPIPASLRMAAGDPATANPAGRRRQGPPAPWSLLEGRRAGPVDAGASQPGPGREACSGTSSPCRT